MKDKGDPAWAKIYGNMDTMQDGLRQQNFGDGTLNRLSYGIATTLDVVQTVCDVVAIYDGINNIQNVYKEIKVSAQKGKVSFGKRFKQYLFNSDSYLKDSKGNPMKWRNILQQRGKIKTLRTDNIMYRVTKARTINLYNKTLTDAQKIASKITKYAKHGKNVVKYAQKFYDYAVDGEWNFKKSLKDIWSETNGNFKITSVIDKLYNIKSKNRKSFMEDYNGFRGLEGLAG